MSSSRDPWGWLNDQSAGCVLPETWGDIPWDKQETLEAFLSGTPFFGRNSFPVWSKLPAPARANLWSHLFLQHPSHRNILLAFWKENQGFLSNSLIELTFSPKFTTPQTSSLISCVSDLVLAHMCHTPLPTTHTMSTACPFIMDWFRTQAEKTSFEKRVWITNGTSMWMDMAHQAYPLVKDHMPQLLDPDRYQKQLGSLFLQLMPWWMEHSQSESSKLAPIWQDTWEHLVGKIKSHAQACHVLTSIAVGTGSSQHKRALYDELAKATPYQIRSIMINQMDPQRLLSRAMWFSWWDMGAAFGVPTSQLMNAHKEDVFRCCSLSVLDGAQIQQVVAKMPEKMKEEWFKVWPTTLWGTYRVRMSLSGHDIQRWRSETLDTLWGKMQQTGAFPKDVPVSQVDYYALNWPGTSIPLDVQGGIPSKTSSVIAAQIQNRAKDFIEVTQTSHLLQKALSHVVPSAPDKPPRKM